MFFMVSHIRISEGNYNKLLILKKILRIETTRFYSFDKIIEWLFEHNINEIGEENNKVLRLTKEELREMVDYIISHGVKNGTQD